MSSYLILAIAIVFFAFIFLIAFFVSFNYIKNKFVKKYGEFSELELKIVDAKRKYTTTKKEVERDIEAFRKEEIIKVKEELLNTKREADEEIKLMKQEITLKETRISKKEENLDYKNQKIEEKEAKLEKQKELLVKKQDELETLIGSQEKELEKIAELTKEEAKDIILSNLDEELTHDKALKIKDYEYNLDREKDKIAKRILSTAINKSASDFVVDATITVCLLYTSPSPRD